MIKTEEYKEGGIAFLEGKPIEVNPYPITSKENDEWFAGWLDIRIFFSRVKCYGLEKEND